MNVAIAAKVCVILCLVLEVQCSEKRQSDSCSDPESYFSSYCWNGITNADDYDAVIEILCTDCRQDAIDFYQECFDADTAEQVDEQCTSLGYPPPTSSLGAVIGGVVGSVVGLIALIFVVILCCCCCYSLNKTTQSSVPPAQRSTQISSAGTHPTVVAPVVGYTTTAPYPTADSVKGGYPTTTPVQGGYPTAPVQGGYPTAPVQGGYPTVQGGYPTAPVQGGYPTAPVQGGYPTAPVQGGYPTAPVQGGYPTAPVQGGYPTAPVQGGYPTAPVQGGYPEGYSAATPAVYYPTAAPMGYYVPGTTSTIDNTCPPPYESAMDYPSASGTANPE